MAEETIKDNTSPAASPNAPNLFIGRGAATPFNSNSYSINNYMYPEDLMSNTANYGGNYAVFYINVSTDSKLFNDGAAETVDDFTPRDRGDLIGQNLSKAGLIGANAIANTIGGALAGGLKGAATANIATLGVGAAVTRTEAARANRPQKRLKTAIALHIPNQLSIRYGMQWSEDDTSLLAMAAAGGEEVIKALQSGGKNSDVKGVGADIIANLALSKGPNAGTNSAALGLAGNPKKEQVFKNVDFRTFSFDYQFAPKSATEAENVLNIIRSFKYHMHPEFKDTTGFLYIYPSEFDIVYYKGTQENLNIHRHTSCVLTEMNVNYTPNGIFSTFANGMPTQINVTLAFRELALLTKDKVKDGM